MTRAFGSMSDYVDFLTSLPITRGELICTSYIPSAFFPKDAVAYYFERSDATPGARVITEKLWGYGKALMKCLEAGEVSLCLENEALQRLCYQGVVHEVVPRFEVAFAARVHVLKRLKRACAHGRVALATSPSPFVFRLHPPSGVLLDVTHNLASQLVQGLWVDDPSVYEVFSREYERLTQTSAFTPSSNDLSNQIDRAIQSLRDGIPYNWLVSPPRNRVRRSPPRS